MVIGAADLGPGKHQEDDAVLKEVAAGSEKCRRRLSTARCPWKKRRMGNWQWRREPSVVGGGRWVRKVVGVQTELLDGEAGPVGSEQQGPERAEANERVGVSAQMNYGSVG
jgi:hypothetical protein